MKKFNLSDYDTKDLEILRKQIKEELIKRDPTKKKKNNHGIMRRILIIHGLKPEDYNEEERKDTETRLFNGRFLLDIPTRIHEPSDRKQYLSSLISQDWKELYPRDTDIGEYYVYAHVDPRHKVFVTTEDAGGNYGGRPFYIGKGIGGRAFDLKRNEGHGKIIKEILKDTFPPSSITRILFSNLSEQKALEIEAKLIYFFALQYTKKIKGWLINLSEPYIPKFIGVMKPMSIRNEHAPK